MQQIVSDYQQMEADGMEEELEKTDWRIVNSWLGTLYPELRDILCMPFAIKSWSRRMKA
ncbi:hypothetical protein [Dorea formicigenerans]|uniref:hypothetical protein n=1 Tax=Dorea formicigenerans TaxID=39486 RepID=UPI001FAA1CDA|nr:hypothetical protein [Dorea formicigenerans]